MPRQEAAGQFLRVLPGWWVSDSVLACWKLLSWQQAAGGEAAVTAGQRLGGEAVDAVARGGNLQVSSMEGCLIIRSAGISGD